MKLNRGLTHPKFWLLAVAAIAAANSIWAQAPPNDNLANAILLSGTNTSVVSTTVGATAETAEPSHAGFPATHSIWFIWTAPDDGSTLLDLDGSAQGTVVAVYTGKYMSSLALVSSNAFGNPDGTGRCEFKVGAGILYDIAVDVSNAPGPVDLNLQFTRTYFPPQITQQPVDQSVAQGDSAVFQVIATSDSPISYQWIYNGSNNIPGATNSILVLTNVSLGQAGPYQVLVSNPGGSIISDNANLHVFSRPPNDNFSNRILLTGSAATTVGSDVFATAENGEPDPLSWPSPQSVWWTWTAPATGLAFVDVTNYTGDQVLVVYTGQTLTQLVAVASSSWFSSPLAIQFEVSGGTSYQITVAGVAGTSGGFQLDLSFLATNLPPVISQQPTNESVLVGATAIFQVVAVSGLPLSYQWWFKGAPLANATNATLVLNNVTTSQQGSYMVVVSNAGGNVPSATASLQVNIPPSNDNFVNRTPLPGLEVTVIGNNQFATSESGEPAHAGYAPGASVWYTWTPPSIGEGYVSVTGFSGSETLGVYTGSVLDQLEGVASGAWISGWPSVHFAVTNGGVPYQIAVADPSGTGGSFQLYADLAISNFPPILVQQLPPITNVIPGQTVLLQTTVDSDWPVTNEWYFDGNPIGSGTLTQTNGTNFIGTLQLDDVSTNQDGTYTVVSTTIGGSVTNTVIVVVDFPPSNDNFTNRITLSGVNLTTSGTTLYATLETGEPRYPGITSGGSVWWSWTAPTPGTATITITGTNAGAQILAVLTGGTLTNLVPLTRAGPNQNPLTLSFLTGAGTTYQIAVVGGDASFQLDLQFLSATLPPQITQQPANVSAPVGGNAFFDIGVIGGGVLNYQWQFLPSFQPPVSWTNIFAATNASLALSEISTNQAGYYRIIVSNLGGSVTSSNAQLTVTLLPPNDNFINRITLTGTNVDTTGSNEYATSEAGEPSHAGWGAGKSVWWTWTAPSDGRLRLSLTNYSGNQVLAVYTGSSVSALTSVANAVWINLPMVTQFSVTSGATYQIAVAGESGVGGAFELELAFTAIIFPPQITQQPSSALVIAGASTNFQVVATGANPLAYQWQFFSTNLPNATNATLTLSNVTTMLAGSYQAFVTNPGGSATSSVATLTVVARPPNDDFVNRIVLTGDAVTTSGSNSYASTEPNEPAHAGYGPFQSVWWSYTPSDFGIVTVDLAGSFYGAVLAVYNGTNLSQLKIVSTNAFANPDGTARVSFLGRPGNVYQIAVASFNPNTSGNIDLAISGDFPPVITAQPQDQAVAPGENAGFGVTARSQSPLSYQWLHNGFAIPGATNQTLFLSNVSTNDAGQYAVKVSNEIGSVTSSNATLSFTTVLIGQVTDATTGDPLGGVVVWVGSITNVTDTNGFYRLAGVEATNLQTDFDASVRSGRAPLPVQFLDLSVFSALVLQAETNGYYTYTNSQIVLTPYHSVTNSFSMSPILPAGTMRLVLNWGTQPRDLDANLVTPGLQGQVYHIYYQTGNRGSLTNLPFAALDHDATNGFGPETITVAELFAGTYSYFVHKYAGLGGIAGSDATVKIYTDMGLENTVVAPTSGDGDYWLVCTIDGGTGAVTIVNQIQSASPADVMSGMAKLPRLPSSGEVLAKDLPPGTASFLWDFGDGNQSTLEDPAHTYTNAGLYTVTLTVSTTNTTVQSVTKTNFIQVLPSTNQPPVVTLTSPVNGALFSAGANVTLAASVSDFSGVVTQVQFFAAGTTLLGAVGSQPYTLVWSNVPAGNYSLTAIAKDNAGLVSVPSAAANIIVDSPPSIIRQPTNVTAVAGTAATFQVVVNGSAPLGFQWFFEATNALVGATNASLTITNVQPLNEGTYSVAITNLVAAVNSAGATLRVLVPPSITQQPISVSTTQGANVNFSVAATGTPPLAYQWWFNATNRIASGTNATLPLLAVQPAQSGNYAATVSNQAGSANSASARLTVIPQVGQLSVSIQSPLDGASFGLGSGIPIVASALEQSASVDSLSLLAQAPDGSQRLLLAVPSASCSFVWTNANAGTNRLSAVAVDALGSSATSSVVRVIITNVPVPVLSISLAEPPNNGAFCYPNSVLLAAAVTNSQPVVSVDFYAGGTLLGSATVPPYQYNWTNAQVASYTLSAQVKDTQGHIALSAPVNITVSPTCTPVAIVRGAVDPEIDALQSYLLDMGLGSQVFDQTGISSNILGRFKLVIWDDVGATNNGLEPHTVDVLNDVYTGGKPLYLIGEHLVSSGAALGGNEQAFWMSLTHLGPAAVPTGNGTVNIVNPEGPSNPILWGQFADIADFAYPPRLEMATNDSVSEAYGQSGGATVLLAFPPVNSPPGPTPIMVQNFRVSPPDALGSTNVLQGLFQNAVCWLTGCGYCQDAGLDLQGTQSSDVVVAGQVMSYTLTASCSGECPPLGVRLTNSLPSGFLFLGATNEAGSWIYDAVHKQVIFFIGVMPKDGSFDLGVTVAPMQVGTFTNDGVICLNLSPTQEELWTMDSPMVTTVVPATNVVPPLLSIQLIAPVGAQLTLSGQVGVVYGLQSSTDLLHWDVAAPAFGPSWTQTFLPWPPTNAAWQFYRALTPQ